MNFHDDSSGSSSDFFSPISMAFFRRPVASAGGTASKNSSSSSHRSDARRHTNNTTLPPSHDNSWIGARLSPIFSFDKEGASDEEDNRSEERHRAMHDTLEAAPFVDERTSLLMRNNATTSATFNADPTPRPHDPTTLHNHAAGGSSSAFGVTHSSTGSNNNINHSKLHPSWRSPSSLLQQQQQQQGDFSTQRRIMRRCYCCCCFSGTGSTLGFGSFVVILSGIHMCAMVVYDSYQWYRRNSNQENGNISESSAWSLPFLAPSYETLTLFGALTPDSIDGEGWNIQSYTGFISSLFISASIVEWAFIAGAWRLLFLSSTRDIRLPVASIAHQSSYERFVLYLVSALTGQLWMWSYDSTSQLAVGCGAWGTCGVLCATGMALPLHRFELFSTATFLVILSLSERPCASVIGCTGSAFFGWALGACGCCHVERNPVDSVHYPGNGNDLKSTPAVTLLGTRCAVLLLSLPVLNLAFRRAY